MGLLDRVEGRVEEATGRRDWVEVGYSASNLYGYGVQGTSLVDLDKEIGERKLLAVAVLEVWKQRNRES